MENTEGAEAIAPPRRQRYSQRQRENAVRLLNLGLQYRQVARMTPDGLPVGEDARRRDKLLRALEELRRRFHR